MTLRVTSDMKLVHRGRLVHQFTEHDTNFIKQHWSKQYGPDVKTVLRILIGHIDRYNICRVLIQCSRYFFIILWSSKTAL